jgi:nucleotide-binding universal stress UspA family protein
MQTFNRALVALDLSKLDREVLQFFAHNSAALGIDKAYFVHIIQDFTMPANIDVEFQKLFAPEYPVDEKVRDKIGLDVAEVLSRGQALEHVIEVIEGKPYEKLVHWVKVKEIDLLVVGKKAVSEGSGITARRVVRNTECNVLFLPGGQLKPVRNIIVPLDFSERSQRAIAVARLISQRLPEATLHGLYVVDLPPEDYYAQSRPGTGYRGILLESAHQAYQSFLRENDLPDDLFEMSFIENESYNIAQHIEAFAAEKEAPLIVMGARGHTPLEAFFFGSVTEKLLDRLSLAPVLVVR